ncbi:MAG TPA: hypothetical protein VFV34_21095 [Blastocatellia bacterium]|nr:hypothetical protein [Blastocatellia bacterium]
MPTTGLPLLLVAITRDQFRWARQHLYFLLVLGPLVLSASYLIVTRVAASAAAFDLSPVAAVAVTTGVQAALVALSLSRASAELFHIRRPEAFLDSMPIAVETHLHVALASRALRVLFAAALIVTARWLITGSSAIAPVALVSVVVWAVVTATSEVWASLNWIHWSHKKRSLIAVGALVSMAASLLLGGTLLLAALRPVRLQASIWLLSVAGLAWSVTLYLASRIAHRGWRGGDVEFARRIHPEARWSLSAGKVRGLNPAVSALLVRDLQLTLRGFSSAVYVAAGLAALSVLALIAVPWSSAISSDYRDVEWLTGPMAVKVACVLSTASLAALTPVLVAYQVPGLWLERTVGATGFDLCRAKIWYARIASAPAGLVTWLAAMAARVAHFPYPAAGLLGECLLLWWLVSSMIGVLSYETPARPGVALLILISIGTAVGIVSASLWPFGVIVYVFTFPSLLNRARERARYFLITGDD